LCGWNGPVQSRRIVAEEVMGGFDVVVLQGICANYFDKHVAPLLTEVRQAQEQLRTQMKELTGAVEQAGTCDMSATLDALTVDMAQKASMAKLDEVVAQMGLKTNGSEESTEDKSNSGADQFEMWLSEAEQKCREQIAAALSPLEERQANTEKTVRSHAAKIAEYKAIGSELECKANVRDVPTIDQFKRLTATVERKANASKVATAAQFGELQSLVETKVNATCVPTLAEFQELRAAVEKKANASSVSCAVTMSANLEKVLAEVQLKANAEEVEKALKEKANCDQVPLSSTVENLASVMERKLAFLAARLQKTSESVDNVLSQAMVCYVPTQPTQTCGTWSRMGEGAGWMTPVIAGDGLAPGGWGEVRAKPEGDSGS